jgi:hypothetical protein
MMSIFFGYVGYIWSKYGILPSISESYYVLPNKQKQLFTLFCWGIAFPAIIIGGVFTKTPLMLLAGSGIVFVGAAAAFKQKVTKTIHFIGAAIGVILSQVSIAYDFHYYILNIIFLAVGLFVIFKKYKSKIWWIEIAAILTILATLGYRLFI